jgi:hypothetical protein
MSDSRILRQRNASLESYRDRMRTGVGEQSRFLGQVTTGGHFPTGPLEVYLVNAVIAIDSKNVENNAPAFNVDATHTIPVVFLEAPSLGDFAVCYSIGGRWVAEKGSATPPSTCCMTPLCSCGKIPQGNATLTISNPLGTDIDLGGTQTLTFAPGGPNGTGIWTSGCFITTAGIQKSSQYWVVTCGTLTLFTIESTDDGSTPTCEGVGTSGTISMQFPIAGSAFPATSCTPSPYTFSWTCPGQPTCGDTPDIGACGNLCEFVFTFASNAVTPGPQMCQNFCIACPFTTSPVTVTVFSSQGGTQLATGMINTPGNSCIFLSWPGQSGSFFYTASAAGLATVSVTASLTCGGTTNIAFASPCLEASVTLTATTGPGAFNGTFGPIPLTLASGVYSGTFVANKATFTVLLNCSTGRLQITGPHSGSVLDTNCCTSLACTCPTLVTFAQSPFNLVETSTTTGGEPLTDGNYNVSCTVMAC